MLQGVVIGFLSYALYSSGDVAAKMLGGSLSIFEVMFLLTLFSFTAVPLAKPREETWADVFHLSRPVLVWVRNISAVASSLFGLYSFTILPLAEAYSLFFLMPAFVTILSIPVLGEKVGWRRSLAVILGFAGVLLVVRPGFRELHFAHLTAVISAALSAVSLLALRMTGSTEKRISLLTTLFLTALVIEGVLMVPHMRLPTWHELALAALGGVLGGAGNLFTLVATRLAPANRVAPTQYSQIIWAVIFGALFFGDFPDPIAFVGMALVIVSGLITLAREEKLHGWWRKTPLLRPRP
jgi:S-adenosylmethionine uptake transporter